MALSVGVGLLPSVVTADDYSPASWYYTALSSGDYSLKAVVTYDVSQWTVFRIYDDTGGQWEEISAIGPFPEVASQMVTVDPCFTAGEIYGWATVEVQRFWSGNRIDDKVEQCDVRWYTFAEPYASGSSVESVSDGTGTTTLIFERVHFNNYDTTNMDFTMKVRDIVNGTWVTVGNYAAQAGPSSFGIVGFSGNIPSSMDATCLDSNGKYQIQIVAGAASYSRYITKP